MNASAYLQAQGWRGSGFSLDQTNRGLSKPLLVSQKTDQTGLGTKKHDFKDQWWTSAFDKSLKSLGSSSGGSSTPTVTNEANHIPIKFSNPALAKHTGLYNRFRKSDILQGTFTPPSDEAEPDVQMSRTKKSKPGRPQQTKAESRTAAGKEQQRDATTGVQERETVGPILGVPASEASSAGPGAVHNDEDAENQQGSRKKRKHIHEEDTEDSTNNETKKQKRVAFAGDEEDGDGVPLPVPATTTTTTTKIDVKERNRAAKRERKALNRETRLQKRREHTAKKEEQAEIRKKRKRAAIEKTEKKGIGLGRSPSPDPNDPRTALVGEAHEESILARRNRGEKIDLPGDPGDPDELRARLVMYMEKGDTKAVKRVLLHSFEGSSTEEKKDKQARNEWEKLKRATKRDARHWVKVRKLTHLYRADGSYIESKDRGVPLEEIRAKRQAEREKKLRRASGKEAKKMEEERKRIEKVEKKRVKKEEKRMMKAEKKKRNHVEQMAHLSAKSRRLKDEEEANAAGRSYDEHVEAKARQLKVDVEAYKKDSKRQLLEKATAAGGDLGVLRAAKGEDGVSKGEDGNVSISEMDETQNEPPKPATSDEFISLQPTDVSESTSASHMGFTVDTTGDTQLAPAVPTSNPVQGTTKSERKKRLEAKKQRRAERSAADGASKMSKDKKPKKGAKKEEKISRMVGEILARDNATGPEATKVARREVRKVLKGSKKKGKR